VTFPTIEKPSGPGLFWGAFLAALVVLLIIPAIRALHSYLTPASRWLDVTSIYIEDAVVGTIPKADIQRTVHRGVLANRSATIYRRDADGEFYRFCQRNSLIDYRAGQSLPPQDLDLEFWLDIPPNPDCPELPAGSYIMSVTWLLQPEGVSQKTLRIESNEFRVTDPADPEAGAMNLPASRERCRGVRVSTRGIIHEPTSPHYPIIRNGTRCFASAQEAIAAGYRLPGQ
jgi:hypothetical protein